MNNFTSRLMLLAAAGLLACGGDDGGAVGSTTPASGGAGGTIAIAGAGGAPGGAGGIAGLAGAAGMSAGGAGAAGSSAGASGGPVSCSVKCGGPACPCPDLPLVKVEVQTVAAKWAFQIEATEVPLSSYRAFLKAKPDVAKQDAWCAFNTSFDGATNLAPNVPKCLTLSLNLAADNTAVSCVDWCDAAAYCAWSGRRLCGGLDGKLAGQAQDSEWGVACAGPNFYAHAYGPTFVEGNCGFDPDAPVGSHPLCEGGVPGLMDMQGGLREWSGNCGGYDGAADNCESQGSYAQQKQDTCPKAGTTSYLDRAYGDVFLGIRCCADL